MCGSTQKYIGICLVIPEFQFILTYMILQSGKEENLHTKNILTFLSEYIFNCIFLSLNVGLQVWKTNQY